MYHSFIMVLFRNLTFKTQIYNWEWIKSTLSIFVLKWINTSILKFPYSFKDERQIWSILLFSPFTPSTRTVQTCRQPQWKPENHCTFKADHKYICRQPWILWLAWASLAINHKNKPWKSVWFPKKEGKILPSCHFSECQQSIFQANRQRRKVLECGLRENVIHEHCISNAACWPACVKCKCIIWKSFHFSRMVNFHVACSLPHLHTCNKVKSGIVYRFQMLKNSLRNVSFPSLSFPSLPSPPFLSHMVSDCATSFEDWVPHPSGVPWHSASQDMRN